MHGDGKESHCIAHGGCHEWDGFLRLVNHRPGEDESGKGSSSVFSGKYLAMGFPAGYSASLGTGRPRAPHFP